METTKVVERLRLLGTDVSSVEVKAAVGKLPKTVVETLSAFSNGSGGTLLLGLSEQDGFAPAEGFDASRIRDALGRACADDLDPPVRAPIEIEELEGALIVRVDVAELDPLQKPAYVRSRGPIQGSFIRGGDGDRRLTIYEVTQLQSNRVQPLDDVEAADHASREDLDATLVRTVVDRARSRSPRAFRELDDDGVLVRLGALRRTAEGVRPTLAGLVCLGQYPQQFLPQLFISFVALPGLTMSDSLGDGTRFLDNQSCNGPIPVMIQEALDAVRRNMRVAAVVHGVGRQDRYDYPLEVIRELVVNAVMHRDYSAHARGTQVQIELYPDRLVVKSPGGIYGSVAVEQLGVEEVSSSRNAVLAKLLAEVPLESRGTMVSENRGSGLPRVMAQLRDAGMSPPKFDAKPSHLHVTVPQHALLDPETVAWIATLNEADLTNAQHLALAMMRSDGTVTHEMLRVWGIESHAATAALTNLVSRALARKQGGRRYAQYTLSESTPDVSLFDDEAEGPYAPRHPSAPMDPKLAAVVEALRAGYNTSRAIQDALGVSYSTTMRRIRELREGGIIEETASRHSTAQSYRLATQGDDPVS